MADLGDAVAIPSNVQLEGLGGGEAREFDAAKCVTALLFLADYVAFVMERAIDRLAHAFAQWDRNLIRWQVPREKNALLHGHFSRLDNVG